MKHLGKEIVYIEYQDGNPHRVDLAEFDKWSLDHWDFDPDCKEGELYMHFNSGSGGLATEIQAPTYAEGVEGCTYWMHPKAGFSGQPKNITRIKEPLEINGSINPFDNSREVYQMIYCQYCEKFLDEDWCEHLTEDEDTGDIVYMNGEPHD